MEIKLHHSTRGIWIFVNGKHKKTVPKNYSKYILENLKNISFDRKYLQPEEKNILQYSIFKDVFTDFLNELESKEKYVFEIIKKHKPIGVRKVVNPQKNREELVFDNNIKIKIPHSLYTKHPIKLPTAYLNY